MNLHLENQARHCCLLLVFTSRNYVWLRISEIRKQKSESGFQKSEIRNRLFEFRNQKSDIGNPYVVVCINPTR